MKERQYRIVETLDANGCRRFWPQVRGWFRWKPIYESYSFLGMSVEIPAKEATFDGAKLWCRCHEMTLRSRVVRDCGASPFGANELMKEKS